MSHSSWACLRCHINGIHKFTLEIWAWRPQIPIVQVTLSRWLMHSVGRVASSGGNCASCPLYSSGHYWWALKLPGVLCIRKKGVEFAYLRSFIRVTCDLYLTFSCKREFPTKRCWNTASPLALRPCFLQNILGWALNQRMLFKWQQWKRFVEILCHYRWICVEE